MSVVLSPPPAPLCRATTPTLARWTVEQFHQLGEDGHLRGRRAKLIHGSIVEEGPMNPPHRIALELTDITVRSAFGPGWRVCVQMPLVLNQDTDPEPDVAVVRGSARAASTHPMTAELVIEVADTSFDFDTTTKAELYATAGIADYWVLDVDTRVLHVLRDPVPLPAGLGATAYRTHLTFTDTQTVTPIAAPNATVNVADLLP